MKKKDFENIKTKDIADLQKLAAEKRLEVAKLFAKIKAGQEKNPKVMKMTRRELAQILTLVRQKEIAEKEGKEK